MMIKNADHRQNYSPYTSFSRHEWAGLRHDAAVGTAGLDLTKLQGLNEQLSFNEISEVYLPLSSLLHHYIISAKQLHAVTSSLFGDKATKVPYIIGIGGSVAVGKSTTARILQALLSRFPDHPKVDLVTTDGFLHPNRVLEQRGLMKRKGFPESYDMRRLLQFMADVKSGLPEVSAPVYSHLAYDILPGEAQVIRQPDILIVEGLNVLQVSQHRDKMNAPQVFVSDFFDFSVYVNAEEELISQWYVNRFKLLRETAFQNPQSYFHRYASLSDQEAVQVALQIWREINSVNLQKNILPTKYRAQLILDKGAGHLVEMVHIRKR